MSNFEYHKRNIIRFYEREKAEKKAEEEARARAKQQKKETPTTPQIEFLTGKAQFLEGELGKQIHEKILSRYNGIEAITKIIYDEKEKIVKGSNPFYVVAVQEFLPEGIRVATQADLERILKTKTLKLEGHYEDSSLVWRSNKDPNEYLAKDIYNQFKARGIEFKKGTPYVIPLFTLKLRKDSNSEYQLAFELTDKTIYFEAPILNRDGWFSSEEIDENTGLFKKVYKEKTEKGSRYSYTINSGLSGFYLGRDLSAGSDGEGLAGSYVYGRVVLVSSEAGTQKI